MKEERILSIDVGTTKIKVISTAEKEWVFEEFPKYALDQVVNQAKEKKHDAILMTGSGALEASKALSDVILMNELESVAHIVPMEGYDSGLVVNMGTGTAFLLYDGGEYSHVTGTGLGGGAFEGLGRRLLQIADPLELEEMAKGGHIEMVNMIIDDIYKEEMSWLQKEITVANFAKGGTRDEDVALAIHSLIIEPILSMVKAAYHMRPVQPVIFTGGVMMNGQIQQLIERYMEYFKIPYQSIEKPNYGTALGAIYLYQSR